MNIFDNLRHATAAKQQNETESHEHPILAQGLEYILGSSKPLEASCAEIVGIAHGASSKGRRV